MRASILAAVATMALAAPASAAFLDSPIPSNAYITFNGADWAWGAPCSADVGSSCDSSAASYLSYQGSQGWRLPTAAEVAAGPSMTDFLFAGANVPFATNLDPVSGASNNYLSTGGSDFACATPYFSSVYRHCDYGDAAPSLCGLYPGGSGCAETWFIRGDVVVPAPAMVALFGLGLAGLAFRRRG
jgi:hypothetical protein